MEALVLPVVVLTWDGPGALIVPVDIAPDGAVVRRGTDVPIDMGSLVVLFEDEADVPALLAA